MAMEGWLRKTHRLKTGFFLMIWSNNRDGREISKEIQLSVKTVKMEFAKTKDANEYQ
jgi:hypothetical protein